MKATSGRNRHRGWIAAAALGAALLVPAAAGAVEVPTRAEYVDRLETICKPDALETQRVMKGARSDINAERLALAAGKFSRAATIFGSTVRKMGVVPKPSGDEPKLGKWFAYLGKQEGYLRQTTTELRAGHTIKAQRLTARFIHNGNLANNVILAFGFNYCSFKFSRYG